MLPAPQASVGLCPFSPLQELVPEATFCCLHSSKTHCAALLSSTECDLVATWLQYNEETLGTSSDQAALLNV